MLLPKNNRPVSIISMVFLLLNTTWGGKHGFLLLNMTWGGKHVFSFAEANIFLFVVLQTFSKIFRAGGGKKIKNKIVYFQHIFIFE